MALIGHWVAADAFGNLTGIIPDRSDTANDGTIEDTGAGGYPYWQNMLSGCNGVEIVPLGIFTAGVVIPDHADYTVTDFTAMVCTEINAGGPSEFNGVMSHSAGAGVNRKWVLGCSEVPTTPTKNEIHISDGSSFTTLQSSAWPKDVIYRDTTIPGQAPATMGGMYIVCVKRSGNTFSFFLKWGVFRASDGVLIDQDTGLAISGNEPDPALALGTASSAIQPGNVAGTMRLGSGGEVGAFGSECNLSWAMFWNEALDSAEILSIMDTQYPICGTANFAAVTPTRAARFECAPGPVACVPDEEA